jgi:predicted transcriptional regulator
VKRVRLRVEPAARALDRFEALWNLDAEGGAPAPEQLLAFPDLPLLLRTLTPARWALLAKLRADGAQSVYALAQSLARDYKNVHTDVKRLVELGLIDRDAGGRVSVGWDSIRAELRLG